MTDWAKIHLLQGGEKLWAIKDGYRRQQLAHYDIEGQREHYWLARHQREGNKKAAEAVWGEILKTRIGIAKWEQLVDEADAQIWKYKQEISRLLPPAPKVRGYPMGGWVRAGEPYRSDRFDQGKDFEIPRYHSVIAPGNGQCIGYGSDRPFPNGFGDPYALVRIDTGPFHDLPVLRGVAPTWYLGHANEPIIRPGEYFKTGQALARVNHSLNEGWGWIELGHLPYGSMHEGEHWASLFNTVWR